MSRKTIEERFWEKVYIRGNDECWEWQASKDKDGYGWFRVDGKTLLSHRAGWEMHNNKKIPNGLCVMHSCDNPSCVNPKHLSLATQQKNIDDMVMKGRSLRGVKREGAGRPKLITKQVLQMIKMWATGEYTKKELSNIFNVSVTTVYSIIAGKTWKHIFNKQIKNNIK